MKTITRNLLLFTATFALATLLFRISLSWSIEHHEFVALWGSAALYFLVNFGLGWFFGKRDYLSLPLADVGFRFHLATFVVFNLITLFWFWLGFNSKHESPNVYGYILIGWGLGLLLHFAFYRQVSKRAIKGIDKGELFD